MTTVPEHPYLADTFARLLAAPTRFMAPPEWSEPGSRRVDFSAMSFESRAVHLGHHPEQHNGSVTLPVYLTTSFEQVAERSWDYSRIANPSRAALEECLAGLDHGSCATATASGMAATTAAVLTACRPGDTVVLGERTYGGVWELFSGLLSGWGIETEVIDLSDPGALEAGFPAGTRLVWAETPANPDLRLVDIAATADVAHRHGALLGVDSTIGSPYLQTPLDLGADIVVHSTTKYLAGHSDVTGGVVVTNDAELDFGIRHTVSVTGSSASPMDSWLTFRGVKTLPARMERICASAQRIAEALAEDRRVSAVHYPGVATGAQAELAARQMHGGYGGVLAIEVPGGGEAARRVLANVRLFTSAVSMGGVESLIQQPATMTHVNTKGTAIEIPEGMLRLSIGLEDPAELLADLGRAIDAAGS
ncbi:MAG: PLP-dependent transferase [Microbacteriaceae bacterium]